MIGSSKSVIVGTAGHIDHGKSSLVEALTGTHPDRLEEEKRRGITIDLGFAFLEENGVRFGFVDVPGHERFVSNMLAGAAGLDLVLLVIAADESIKPQTREHFDICRLLGVQRGVVALTKSDLVDADAAGLVRLEVEEYLRDSFLEGAPFVPVSAKTQAGLPELKQALLAVAQQSPAAVNLSGIEYTALRRGMVLTTTGKFRATRRIDTRLELLRSAPKMKQHSRVHFHAGTCQTVAELVFFAEKDLAPGQNAFAQLRLQDDVLVLPGDRFIVRQFSPVTTIGGGVVLDPLARRPTLRDTGRAAFLETLERGDSIETLAAMTERAVLGLSFEEMVARTGWPENRIRAAAKSLAESGQIRIVSAEPLALLSGKSFDEVRQKIGARVEKFHKENPLLPGISRELQAQKKLETHGDIVKRAGAAIHLDPEEARAKEEIEKAFAIAGLAVPSVKEVLSKLPVEARRAEKILQILLRDKILVRVTPELIFHRDTLAQLRDRLSIFKKTKGERISVPVFKELTGITRKYAIPLLEYLDRERVTRRAGDERVIL